MNFNSQKNCLCVQIADHSYSTQLKYFVFSQLINFIFFLQSNHSCIFLVFFLEMHFLGIYSRF